MNDKQKLKNFLSTQTHMVLAVTCDDGTPWATPLKIQLQWGNAFEWDSRLDSEHSKAIAARPDVALVLFDKDSDAEIGVYIKAKAELVEDKGDGFGRYRALAKQIWLNDETFVKREVELPADA